MKASIDFVRNTEILHILNLIKTEELMNDLNKQKIIGASMNQLGKSAYCFCKSKDEKKVLEVYDSYIKDSKLFVKSLEVCHKGPILKE